MDGAPAVRGSPLTPDPSPPEGARGALFFPSLPLGERGWGEGVASRGLRLGVVEGRNQVGGQRRVQQRQDDLMVAGELDALRRWAFQHVDGAAITALLVH